MSKVEERVYSNVDRMIEHGLVSPTRINELKKEVIESAVIQPWEYEVDPLTNVFIDPSKISGTKHPRYSEMSLFDAVNRLKRGKGRILNFMQFPGYYVSNEARVRDEDKLCIAYKKNEDKYYIKGDGNHRFLLSKTLGLEKILVNTVTVYEEDSELKSLLEKINAIGFEYEVSRDKIVTLDSDFAKIEILKPIKENLKNFLNQYNQIKVGKVTEMKYKLKLSLGNHRRKFEYHRNPVKHIVQFHFLNLQEHKRNQKIK